MSDLFLATLLTSLEQNEAVALVTVVEATGKYASSRGQRALIWLNKPMFGEIALGEVTAHLLTQAQTCLINSQIELLTHTDPDGQVALFVEVQPQRPTLLIVGAGHVALPLAQLGKLVDFEVVVLDDRPLYANKERFPMADQVLAQPFQATLRDWPITANSYIVLVTRGHNHDVDCLIEVLKSAARYIGMIGSKRRVKAVFELLINEQGINPHDLERVYAPIGLDIGAESPAEIAVSIMAEIINIQRGGRAISLAEALRVNKGLPLHPQRHQTKQTSKS